MSTIVGNNESEHQKANRTTDDHTIDDEQQLLKTNKISPPPTIQSTATKIAPRPPGMPHNPSTSIATMIKTEPVDNELFDCRRHNLIGTNTATLPSHTTSTCLSPGVDGGMAATLLQTDLNLPTSNFTTSATAAGTLPLDTSAAGIGSMGIGQYVRTSMPALSQFGFIQAHEDISTPGNLPLLQFTLSYVGQKSQPSPATHAATSTTTAPIENLCDMTTLAQLQQQQPLEVAEMLRKELNHQKVRNDNRERKKRWREQNEERNKDNDLRSRVKKRARSLFGKEDSEQKQRWINEEFVKRQCRRRNKERRRTVMDDAVLSASPCSSVTYAPSTTQNMKNEPPHAISGQLPVLPEAYISVLFNNIISLPPAVILKLAEEIQLLETTMKKSGIDQERVLSQQLADFLRRLQQLHSLSLTESPGTTSTSTPASVTCSSSPIISATSASPTIKSESSTLPVSQCLETSKSASSGGKLQENENGSAPATTPQSPLQTHSTATASPSSELTLPNTNVTTSENSAQQASTNKGPLSAESYTANALHRNKEARETTTKSFENRNEVIPTSTTHRYSDHDSGLSALLVKTLQQTALIYQEKLRNVTTPPTPSPPSSSSSAAAATMEYNGYNKPQHLFQLLYPSGAIRTLTKIYTEWTKQ